MLVRGFHGTNLVAARKITAEGFVPSANEYDWLGDGAYFFQDAPRRAFEWARELHGPEAAIVGADIELINCMDLLDIEWCSTLTEVHDEFVKKLKAANLPLPRQSAGAHRLDRAVINYSAGVLAEKGIHIRSVRAAFSEGRPLFPNSALIDRAHVEIAVRDLAVIRHVWLEKMDV
ncbi:MAG TPA: hypothetical protein VG651_05900 [Stellaceae bacterium]|nr:hypothetical protein [Stellaceae bacterium]